MNFIPENTSLQKEQSSPIMPETVSTSNEKNYLPDIQIADGLPSQFIPYPDNVVIKYNPYTFGELKKISQSTLSIKEEFKFILEGIKVENMDALDLTLPDFMFINLLRNISSLGTQKASVDFLCPQCTTPNTTTIEIKGNSQDIEFEDLMIDELPIIATLSTGEYHFSPIRLKDYFALIDNKKENDLIAWLAAQCRNISFDEAYEAFFNANAIDTEILEEVDRLLNHDLKPIPAHCTNCSETVNVELIGGDAVLKPFRAADEHQQFIKSSIRFGA